MNTSVLDLNELRLKWLIIVSLLMQLFVMIWLRGLRSKQNVRGIGHLLGICHT